jgi:hypothetical protein
VEGRLVSVLDFVRNTGDSHAPAALPVDDVWEVFRNPRRRMVIRYVANMPSGGAVSLGVLASDLAEQEYGPGYSSSERKCIYNALYQVHLEKLDAVGAVEYDADRGIVRPGASVSRLASALDAVAEVVA